MSSVCRPPVRALFWLSSALLAWTQAGYAIALAAIGRGRPSPDPSPAPDGDEPLVSLIVAAYREQAVIARKVANALALEWPREQLEVIVAVDGGADRGADATAERAREAGADVVLELPRGGKMRAQDAAADVARGELLAFSDANALWEPDALRALAGAFADPDVGYACGQVAFVNDDGTNQEGLYWRYELWIRRHESTLASVTAGNGAIYAVRAADYEPTEPPMGHDLSLPFRMVARGRRAVYVAQARATEKMVPTIEGEWARKRRMMTQAWPIVLYGGLARLGDFPAPYAAMVVSHRLLRYASPFLHLLALAASLLLSGRRLYRAAALAQGALVAAAVAGGRVPVRPLLLARYYVLTTAAIAAGLADHLRHGTPEGWETPEGTR
jgi:cellulose synthase/poly-beta-1,6-N-acetylglucosamine synthase-like glycosyltransferase